MDLWWKCPNCKGKVDFTHEASEVFDEDGEADFDPSMGLFFHTLFCACGNAWSMTISKPSLGLE